MGGVALSASPAARIVIAALIIVFILITVSELR